MVLSKGSSHNLFLENSCLLLYWGISSAVYVQSQFYWFKFLLRSVFTRTHEVISCLNHNQSKWLYIFENHNSLSCNWKNYPGSHRRAGNFWTLLTFNILRLFQMMWVLLATYAKYQPLTMLWQRGFVTRLLALTVSNGFKQSVEFLIWGLDLLFPAPLPLCILLMLQATIML